MTPAAWSTYRRGACLPGSRAYGLHRLLTRLHVERRLAAWPSKREEAAR